MKLTKIAIPSLVLTIAAGCSNNEPTIIPGEDAGSKGYISLEISLPTAEGNNARAVEVEAGSPDEYAVKNGRLIVFKNDGSEADAKCVYVADITDMNWSAATTGDITTSTKAFAQLDNIDLSDNSAQYSGLVVLNYNSDFNFPAEGQTLGQWSKTAQSGSMILEADGKNFLTMSTAPEYSSTLADVVLLAPINKALIMQSKSDAVAAAVTTTVQRALAKVVLVTNTDGYSVTGSSHLGDKVSLKAWGLDIKNRTSYPVQIATGLKQTFSKIWETPRFLAAQSQGFRRVYWAIDPNYDQPVENEAAIRSHFHLTTAALLTSNDACAYCLENTFDIRHQLQGQTTRVAMKAQYVPAGLTAGTTFYQVSSSLLDKDGLENLIKQNIDGDVSVDLGNVANVAGEHSLNEITISRNGTALSAEAKEALASALNLMSAADASIRTFVNGECFYFVRVKHFGESETPWNIGDKTYNDDNTKWLGRYGMVRNTVYSVTINSISAPGSPVVTLPDPLVPDDENDYFINADINVYAWAKRTHSVDL